MRFAVCVVLALGSTSAVAAPKEVADPTAWLSERGVKDPDTQLGDVCCCAEVRVGKPAETALDCKEARPGGHAESADIAVAEVIRVVRAGKAVTVLDAWVGLQNLDLPPGSGHWLDSSLTLDRTGRVLTIAGAGKSHYDCTGTRGTTDFDKWLVRVCASRGTYRWSGRRFVRAAR